MTGDRQREWVEVVYATPDVQRIVELPSTEGLTAAEAARRSGLLEEFPEITERELVLGLFGERVEPAHVLVAGDRLEICRPLLRDPRTLRRELSARGQVMGAAGREAAEPGDGS